MATTFTDGLLASLTNWCPPGSDGFNFWTAWGQMLEPVWTIVADQGSPDEPETYQPGWGILLDVNNCPTQYLPWLGMFVGVYVPPGTDDALARMLIQNQPGYKRGSAAAIIAAAQTQLSGTQTVVLLERTNATGDPDPYWFQLIVLTAEVIDATALQLAVNLAKPAGVQWTFVSTTSWTVSEIESGYLTINAVEAAFASITACEGDVT